MCVFIPQNIRTKGNIFSKSQLSIYLMLWSTVRVLMFGHLKIFVQGEQISPSKGVNVQDIQICS